MANSQLLPAKTSRDDRMARKVEELVAEHGSFVRQLIDSGKLPTKQILNFYGRHVDVRESILSAMKSGTSYSKAYEDSKGLFDTKRWAKVHNRTSACRGMLLKATAGLVAKGLLGKWNPTQIVEAEQLATDLGREAQKLIQQLAHLEMKEVQKRTPQKRKRIDPCKLEKCRTAFVCVAGQLKTAITKLQKTSRDVPLLKEKLGTAPTVNDVAHTVVEAGRIITGVPLFIAALESAGRTRRPRKSAKDHWGIGVEYAAWLDGRLSHPQPAVRIATHCGPDADALVATWLTERFIFAESECQVEFVPYSFVPGTDCPFDAVVDVGKKYDSSRLIFDHKPPAFQHRDEECATSLVWHHAKTERCEVGHLNDLVKLVHDGDAATRRHRSTAFKQSQKNGFHALVKATRAYAQNDQMLYQAIAGYLDAIFARN